MYACSCICLILWPKPLQLDIYIFRGCGPLFFVFMTVGPYTYSVFILCIFVCLSVCMYAWCSCIGLIVFPSFFRNLVTVGPCSWFYDCGSLYIFCIYSMYVCMFVCLYVCLLMHLPNPLAKASVLFFQLRTRLEI
jgi:hypothetical protein